MAITGVGVHFPVKVAPLDAPVSGADKYISMDGIRLNRAVAGFNLQVRLARHPDFNVQSPGILAPAPVPMAGNASGQFHSVAVLASVHGEILAQFKSMVFNAKFHLFGVAGGNADTPVIGVHLYAGPPSHCVRLDDFFSPD